jgi:hypothetical protein
MSLRKSLQPSASVHQKRDLMALRGLALEVQELSQGLPHAEVLKIQKDLQIAIKGIVTERKPSRKEKPKLCGGDDIFDY